MRASRSVCAVLAVLLAAAPAVSATPAGKPSKPGKPASVGKPASPRGPAAKPVTGKAAAPTRTRNAAPVKTRPAGKPAATAKPSRAITTTAPSALNPIAAKIASKPNLSARLTRMLPIDPRTGTTMTLDKASFGFKNQGQFIAALHVSQNLGIPFAELKRHMVTVTPGAPGEPATATQTGSLGRAIQASKTAADAPTEVRRAEAQASLDLHATVTASASATTAPSRMKTTGAGAR
jgi:hypothetical protein